MKKRWKKLIVAGLACAVVVGIGLPAAQAEAATAKPALNKTQATVSVGQTLQLKVKSKISGSTYKWSSSKAAVAKVSKKGVVTGIKAGSANIKCQVKAPSKTYNLKCKVTVSSAVKVTTQKELKKALKNANVKDITLATTTTGTIKVVAGDYSDKTLTVNVPNGSVNNYGVFKTVTIKKIKPATYRERTNGNTIIVKAPEANIVVADNAAAKEVRCGKKDAKMTVQVKGKGSVDLVNVKKSQDLNIKSEGQVKEVRLNQPTTVKAEGTATLPITVTADAKGSAIAATVPVNVTTATDVAVDLGAAAANSNIAVTGAGANVEVTGDAAKANVEVAAGAAGAKVTAEVPVAVTANAPVELTAKADATVTLNAAAANSTVKVDAAGIKVDVTGTASSVAIEATANATNANITSNVTADIKADANVGITLNGGAEGSTVTVPNEDVKVDVDNKTDANVEVKDESTGTVDVIPPEEDEPITPGPDQPGPGPGTDEPGTDNPGTDEPGTDEPGTDNPGTTTPITPPATTGTITIDESGDTYSVTLPTTNSAYKITVGTTTASINTSALEKAITDANEGLATVTSANLADKLTKAATDYNAVSTSSKMTVTGTNVTLTNPFADEISLTDVAVSGSNVTFKKGTTVYTASTIPNGIKIANGNVTYAQITCANNEIVITVSKTAAQEMFGVTNTAGIAITY